MRILQWKLPAAKEIYYQQPLTFVDRQLFQSMIDRGKYFIKSIFKNNTT